MLKDNPLVVLIDCIFKIHVYSLENAPLMKLFLDCFQVSQLLIAVESGFVNKWKGKNLSEVSVDGK